MESKYLVFDKSELPGRKTSAYYVKSRKSMDILGVIVFYPAWRKYVFEPCGDTIFDCNCLSDIAAFLQNETILWRASLSQKAKL